MELLNNVVGSTDRNTWYTTNFLRSDINLMKMENKDNKYGNSIEMNTEVYKNMLKDLARPHSIA